MANNLDFIVNNTITVGGPIKSTIGSKTVTTSIVPYDMSAVFFEAKIFTVSAQTSLPTDIAFNDDDTKMYIVSDSGNEILQYTLSTAKDVSTASYDSVNFSVNSQDPTPRGIAFKPDGTKMYVMGNSNKTVYQYSLSTAWDLSTASYDTKSFSVNSQETNPETVAFSSDGTKMYAAGQTAAQIFQYTLSTPWDVSTASYDSVSLNPADSLYNISIVFSPDGTKMYNMGGAGSKNVDEYSLSTAWDISTATYTGYSFDFSVQDGVFGGGGGIALSSDGTKLYLVGQGNDRVYQYNLSSSLYVNNFDLSTGNYFTHTSEGSDLIEFINPGEAQTFQLELSANDEEVTQYFNTTIYDGDTGGLTVTNNIDLSGSGGLVWIKQLNGGNDHALYDTVRGATLEFRTGTNQADVVVSTGLTAFSNTGFTLGGSANTSALNSEYVAWTFREKPGFFDIRRYAGDGNSTKQIGHSLGVRPGFIIVKSDDSTSTWMVYHKDVTIGRFLNLASSAASSSDSTAFQSTDQSKFTIGSNAQLNTFGNNYTAYIFAHNEGVPGYSSGGFGPNNDTDIIRCGSYTGDGQASGNIIDVGFVPQWLLIRRDDWATTNGGGNWYIFDTVRGIVTGGADSYLRANVGLADASLDLIDLTDNGFELKTTSSELNNNGDLYVYVAIRNSDTNITWPTSIQWPQGVAPIVPDGNQTDLFTFSTTDSGNTYVGLHTSDNLS